MGRVRVLVVEDEETCQELYEKIFRLHDEEFSWVLAKTGDSALAALADAHQCFDVVLIDWYLERGTKTGFQVLQAIRSNPATRPVVAFMVTANEHDQDIQAAIEAGADDYIHKPFDPDVLMARLRGRINRRRQEVPDKPKVFEVDGLRLDTATGSVMLNGNRVELYPTELALLMQFLGNPDRPLAADDLWHDIRGYKSRTAGKALMVQICNLRKRLGSWGARIETLRGKGYLLNTRLPVL